MLVLYVSGKFLLTRWFIGTRILCLSLYENFDDLFNSTTKNTLDVLMCITHDVCCYSCVVWY